MWVIQLPCFLFISGVILATMIVMWWQPIWESVYVFLVDSDLNNSSEAAHNLHASWGNVSPCIGVFLLDFSCVYFKYQLLRVIFQIMVAMYVDSKHHPGHTFSFHPLSQGNMVKFYLSNFLLLKIFISASGETTKLAHLFLCLRTSVKFTARTSSTSHL